VHPRYGTPGFATVITGLFVGIPLLFIDMDTVVDLCSIGTLFAFILVCGGVLMLHNKTGIHRKFRVPYLNGQWIIPAIFLCTTGYIGTCMPDWLHEHVNPFVHHTSAPMFVFFLVFGFVSLFSFLKKFSFIPVMGILTCTYLMAQIHVKNWIGFLAWLIAGLIIYFTYSYRNSRLGKTAHAATLNHP
jgi:amino acid transporter